MVLVYAMQASSFASATGAMLRVNGQANVDGVSVPGSMALGDGQAVTTEMSSVATLDIGTSKVFISPNTLVKYINREELSLTRGGLFVDTNQMVRTDLGTCAVVTPIGSANAAPTKYEIQLRGDTAYVYARELPVTVRAESRTIDLKPQTMAVIRGYLNPNCKVAYYEDGLTPPEKFLLAGSATAAVAVGVGIGRHQMSASKP